MFLLLFFSESDFNLFGQTCENIHQRSHIISCTLLLIPECDINHSHQRNCMVAFASFIQLGIGIVPVGYQFSGSAIKLFFGAVDHHFYLLIIYMKPDV